MDRQKITDILNRIITLKGEVYDLSHTEGSPQERNRLSWTLTCLEDAERALKESLFQ